MLALNLFYGLDWPQTVILLQPPSTITRVGEMCFKSLAYSSRLLFPLQLLSFGVKIGVIFVTILTGHFLCLRHSSKLCHLSFHSSPSVPQIIIRQTRLPRLAQLVLEASTSILYFLK